MNPNFVVSVDAKKLYAALLGVPRDGTIAYKALSNVIDRDVTNGARGALNTARRMAQNNDGIVFDVIRNEGLKRLADDEIAQTGTRVVSGIHRAARRGMKRLACVKDFTSMNREAQTQHNTSMSMLGVIDHATKPSSVKKLETKVQTAGETLSLAKTLDEFKK